MSDGDEPPRKSASEILREAAATTVGVVAAVVALSLLASVWGPLSRYLYVLVGGIFVGVPYVLLESKGWSFERFGLTTDGWLRDVGLGLAFAAVTLVPFAVGFWVWKTQIVGETFAFDWGHYLKWEPELEGPPPEWGASPGVWVWRENRRLHVGLRSAEQTELEVRLSAPRDAPFERRGRVRIEPVHKERAGEWQLRVEGGAGRAEVVFAPGPGDEARFPRRVTVRAVEGVGARPVRVGGSADRRGAPVRVDRSYRWLMLWLLTQILVVALPEEFFYRGYLQTRVADWLRTKRREEEGEGRVRTWWGISESNLVVSVVFGVGHLVVPVGGRLLWTRVSVAFPALVFGWLRDRTGTIVAAVTYHAACNMMVRVAAPHFF